MENNIKKMPYYTVGEEVANSVIHGIGALLAIIACVVLIVTAASSGEVLKVVSSSVYGASLIIMFTMSTLYHALTNERAKKIFRIFDHTSIFILIAGTYTPLALITLQGAVGWTIFGVIWAIAILGIILNSISIERFKKFSMIAYIAMGWCVLLAILPLVKKMLLGGLIYLFLGGLFYTIGILFYKKKVKYMHSIWHVFVLVGAIMHYFCIQLYVIR